jgi:hypothetical protein
MSFVDYSPRKEPLFDATNINGGRDQYFDNKSANGNLEELKNNGLKINEGPEK